MFNSAVPLLSACTIYSRQRCCCVLRFRNPHSVFINCTASAQGSWVASLITATPRASEGKSHPSTPTAGVVPLSSVIKAKTLQEDCSSLALWNLWKSLTHPNRSRKCFWREKLSTEFCLAKDFCGMLTTSK